MARDQKKLCVLCEHFGENGRCHGVTDLVTGRKMIFLAQTARHDNKYCGPSGKLFEPANLANEKPSPQVLPEPAPVRRLRAINDKQRKEKA